MAGPHVRRDGWRVHGDRERAHGTGLRLDSDDDSDGEPKLPGDDRQPRDVPGRDLDMAGPQTIVLYYIN